MTIETREPVYCPVCGSMKTQSYAEHNRFVILCRNEKCETKSVSIEETKRINE